jgi:Flp pilus assembly protein CpaB
VLLAGIFLAAVTFIVVILLIGPGGGGGGGAIASAPPTTRDVVVAVSDISLGTTIDSTMVTTQNVAVTAVNAGAFQTTSQAIGQVVFAPVKAGEQITAAIVSPEGGANAHPDPGVGKRAFAVSVNELTGVGNLVRISDFVDVLISENVTVVQRNPDGTVSTIPGVENALTVKMPLLLENVQVIGVINQAVATSQNGQPAASPAAGTLTGASKLLILAVTPQQAEVLLFARTSGTIDVVYRAAQDTATVTTDGVILKTLIDKYGVLPPTVIISQIP